MLAQQIEQEGSQSPADVFFTENTPPLARLDERACSRRWTPRPWPRCRRRTAPPTTTGSVCRPAVSVLVYNTDELKPSAAAHVDLDLADPKWKGKLDIAPGETDFAPIVTSIAEDRGDAAAVTWLKAIKENAGSHQDPDNETLVANVNKGVTQLGVINHYYWYRLQDEVGPGRHALRARAVRHRRRRLPARTSPARRSSSRASTRRRPRRWSRSSSARRARRCWPTATAGSTRSARA